MKSQKIQKYTTPLNYGLIMWLKYVFSSLKKIINIEVKYDLITQSGNTIHTIYEDFKPKEWIIKEYSDFDWRIWHKVVKDNYGEIFDEKAKQILNNFQEQERKKLKNGWLDSGEYIVKCIWNTQVEKEWIDYEEYKTFKLKK